MDWERLLCKDRLGEVTPTNSPSDVRSEFERDADRIIYSGPFRRLSRKTQVHPLAPNDHVHNRLTHSLETGQVGRALAKAVFNRIQRDLPPTVTAADLGALVQAACLAHDIGNPPFGHAGEEAMMTWFGAHKERFKSLAPDERLDLFAFDGNAQGFRILTKIENHLFAGGLRLTYAALATFLKYPNPPAAGVKKFSVFASERAVLDEVADRVGLQRIDGKYCRHPLAYLVEAADDICYCVLDLEDAVELGILPFNDAAEMMIRSVDEKTAKTMRQVMGTADRQMFRVLFARLRGLVFASLIEAAVEGFTLGYSDIMAGLNRSSVFAILGADDPRTRFIAESKDVGLKRIYTDVKKVEVEIGSFATLDILLSEFCEAARECAVHLKDGEAAPSWKSKLVMRLMGDHAPKATNIPDADGWTEYQCYRRAVDFVSGATDNYATYLGKQLRGDAHTGAQRP